jgi:hypothetical protein
LNQKAPTPVADIGGINLTALSGQTYTTYPGSRLLFPTLCKPTAPVSAPAVVDLEPNRGLMMPRRKNTRLNDEYVAERNRPPPA